MKSVDAAHLLRRFGFGANHREVAALGKLSDDEAIARVLDFESPEARCPVHPYEFCFDGNGGLGFEPFKFTAYWALRILLSPQPAREKLTLFWHNHFATSGVKVTNGLLMHTQLQTFRKLGPGKFRDLLHEMAHDPAMLVWLDGQFSVKGAPNENFARELLELFTLGIGHYTERDVQEAARAFTGWNIRHVYPSTQRERLRHFVRVARTGEDTFFASYTPGLCDLGPKTFLGETKNFSANDVLDKVAAHPQTSKYLAQKLLEFYVTPEPSTKLIDRVASEFRKNDGHTAKTLRFLAELDEFWRPDTRRALVKSPADYVLGFMRQLADSDWILQGRKADAKPEDPLVNRVKGIANICVNAMNRMGMRLLYPPDVNGWAWGSGWISSATALERIRFPETIGNRVDAGPLLLKRNLTELQALGSVSAAVEGFATLMDAPDDPEIMPALTGVFEKAGGVASFERTNTLQPATRVAFRLLGASPGYQKF